MSELAARCEALRLENERRADAPQAPRFAPSERDPIEEGDTSEEARGGQGGGGVGGILIKEWIVCFSVKHAI